MQGCLSPRIIPNILPRQKFLTGFTHHDRYLRLRKAAFVLVLWQRSDKMSV